MALLAGIVGFVIIYAAVDLPPMPDPPQSSVVLDVHGQPIATFSRGGERKIVRLGQVAPIVVKALVASEDRHFYDHGGVDPVGTARAFVNNVRGRHLQGGSTITQQLVKNSYLSPERSLRRKVKEAILAIKLDRREDKDQILEQYLNTVYFGRGVYGIEAAAQEYFGISARRLQLEQAALLIGLLRSPERSEPTAHPQRATRERNRVLGAMVTTHAISRSHGRAAEARPLGVRPARSRVKLRANVSPFFVEWVRQQVIEEYGAEAVYGAGLRITTTLDLKDQLYADAAVRSVLDRPDDPQAALVALDRTGGVKAYVGGRDYATSKVDLARGRGGGGSGRQAGSTFKPFVLATALANGIPLGTRFPGPPHIELQTADGPWPVSNFGNESFGDIDLVTATAHSVNTVYAQLMDQVGPQRVADMAESLGITSKLTPRYSLALGAGEVSVLDMADSYLTFAREGVRYKPHAIKRVVDADGRVLFDEPADGEGTRVLQPGQANAVTHALQEVLRDGTGTAARLDRPAAGKTGTTQNYGDAWFAGYTPEYAAVVWMGYPEGPAHAMTDVHGRSVTGGSFPAEIWHAFMEKALSDVPPTDFGAVPQDLLEARKAPPAPKVTASTSPSTSTSSPTSSTTSTSAPPATTQPTPTTDPGLPLPTILGPTTTTTTTSPPTTTTATPGTTPASTPAEPP